MSKIEKIFHRALISIVLSVLNWLIIDNLVVSIPLWKYFILELLFVVSMNLYKFAVQKLHLQ